MKHLLSVTAILLAAQFSYAQDQYRPVPTTNSQVIITYQGGQSSPATIQHAPTPVVVASDCKTTACVTEPKKNTKVVYTSRCKEYCVPNCSLFSCFSSDCGCCDNCEKRTRNVLVKKIVPACDTTQCVLKEVPAGYCAPCGK
jgi:hypothetical protein